MKQAVLTSPETITFSEIEKPVIKPNEILMKVKNIGICGSDIHAYYGKHPFMSFPIRLGHNPFSPSWASGCHCPNHSFRHGRNPHSGSAGRSHLTYSQDSQDRQTAACIRGFRHSAVKTFLKIFHHTGDNFLI